MHGDGRRGQLRERELQVQVRTPTEQITRLVDKTVADLDLAGAAAGLQTAAADRRGRAGRQNRPVACAALNVYIGLVRLAPPQAFTPAEKTDLIADANRIRAVVGC